MYTQKPNERSPVYTRTQTNTNEFKKIAHLILLQMKECEQNQQKKHLRMEMREESIGAWNGTGTSSLVEYRRFGLRPLVDW